MGAEQQDAARPHDWFEVRTWREGDEPQVLALLQDAFGRWPNPVFVANDDPVEFFRWKHLSSPAGPSTMILAESEGRPIALRAYMQVPLRGPHGPVATTQAVDLATHPDHRGKGVNWALVERALEILSKHDLDMGFPNKASLRQSIKVGWHRVADVPVWLRVRRPARFLRRASSLRTPPQPGAPRAEIDAATAVECLSDGAAVQELLREADGGDGRLATEKDVDYLRWRYQPMLSEYHAVTAEDAGALSGLAIFNRRARGTLWEAGLCELIVRPGDRRTARRLIRQVAKAAPVDYVAAVHTHGSTEARALAATGFVPSPLGRMTFGVYTHHDGITPDPRERSSWALSLGDLERLKFC